MSPSSTIRVSPPAARFTDLPRPATPMQAKFSLRHCAAAAVVFRRLGTEELSAEVLTRPDVIDLRDRVKVVTDPALGKQDADVEITLASGRDAVHRGARQPRHTVGATRRRRARREVPRAGRTRCWARSAPSGCWTPAGASTSFPTSRCCWSRPSRRSRSAATFSHANG